jgi:hypothetical protein
MCYVLCLSTSSDDDLTRFNSDLISFEPLADEDDDEGIGILTNPHRWYVSARTGCSCAFRHLADGKLVFDEPQDWFPEEQDDIEATAELCRVIDALLVVGYEADCLDRWCDASLDAIQSMKVDLRAVSEQAFRLFENHHFVFERGG